MGERRRYRNAGDCPAIETHTACPDDYVNWHDWAERMSKTHRQRRCRSCGFYAIWEPSHG